MRYAVASYSWRLGGGCHGLTSAWGCDHRGSRPPTKVSAFTGATALMMAESATACVT